MKKQVEKENKQKTKLLDKQKKIKMNEDIYKKNFERNYQT